MYLLNSNPHFVMLSELNLEKIVHEKPSHSTISDEEVVRRRKLVSKANWSAEMEGLGRQTPEYNALSELWVSGEIDREELEKRRMEMVLDRVKNHA